MSDFLAFAWQHLPALLRGLQYTLLIWVVVVVFGFIFGWLLAVARIYGNPVMRWLAIGYIELFRGTPVLVQLFIVYSGLPNIGIVFTPIVAAMVAFSLNTSAYQAEYFRGGVGAIRSGQTAAARAAGMTRRQAISYIVLPQAMRIVLPQWSNEVILELKYTSIAFAIGVHELMGEAKLIGADTFNYFQIFLVAAIVYFVVVTIFTSVLDGVERRYALRQ
ncbi:amino acid ABC transporter permease [Halomonas sp.]|uniref:amino acid ABC transporter permease n=1 Tax=Halomonas sp. TaxID=1486246 RepID=UPI003567FBA3